MDIIYPLSKKGVKTSGFGYRNITGNRTHHNGIDIGVPDGTPVLSVADGEVVRSDMNDYGGYGNFIIIDHDGYLSAYAHLTDRQVKVGDKVKQGEQIALSGGGQGKANGAGSSTGPHLHFEIRKSKNARDKSEFEDPEPYLSGKSPSGIKSGEDKETPKKVKLRKKLTFSGYGGQAANNIRLLIKKMKSKGIKDPVAQLGILATIGKESGFIPQNEIGYCGTPDSSIISIFGSRGKKCKSLKCDDEEFFDCVYGKDSGAHLGNTQPGDGYKYRGRGFNQITGRYNYKQHGYESNPEELNDVDGAADEAIKFLVKDNPSSLNNKFDSIDDSIRHFVKINAGGSPSGGSFSKAKNVADKFKIVDSKESDDYESDVDSDVEDEVDDISSEDKAKKGLELLKKFIEIGKLGKENLKEEIDRMRDLMKKIV